jgi:hypothetical protein
MEFGWEIQYFRCIYFEILESECEDLSCNFFGVAM